MSKAIHGRVRMLARHSEGAEILVVERSESSAPFEGRTVVTRSEWVQLPATLAGEAYALLGRTVIVWASAGLAERIAVQASLPGMSCVAG